MGIEVYLGEPPNHIKDWIINNSKPAGNPKTHIKFVDGTEGDYLIEGAMNCPALVAAELMPKGSGTTYGPSWITYPKEVEIGSAVTSIEDVFYYCRDLTRVIIPNSVISIGNNAFCGCGKLTSVTIPDSVTSIERKVFRDCTLLTNVTFSGKNKATVQGMANYSWGMGSGCVIHCTDGNITL